MALTDTEIKSLQASGKSRKYSDERGLMLLVQPSGTKLWQFSYSHAGKKRTLSFGPYPDVSLNEARDKRDAARALLRDGHDPQAVKRAAVEAAGITVEIMARQWHEAASLRWSGKHRQTVIKALEQWVFPAIGDRPIASITKPQILTEIVRPMEAKGLGNRTHKVIQMLGAVFDWAEGEGRVSANPCRNLSLRPAPITRNRPALTELEDLRTLMRKLDEQALHPVTRLAIRFTALTHMRSNAIATLNWPELSGLDGDNPVWNATGEKLKVKRPIIIPLCRQAVEVIEAVRTITGKGPYVFPNDRWLDRPMTPNTMLYALNRAGYANIHCPHGFRTSFSTIMHTRNVADHAYIEVALQHVDGSVSGIYNRSLYLEKRRELNQIYADMLLDGMLPAADLLALPKKSRDEEEHPVIEDAPDLRECHQANPTSLEEFGSGYLPAELLKLIE